MAVDWQMFLDMMFIQSLIMATLDTVAAPGLEIKQLINCHPSHHCLNCN